MADMRGFLGGVSVGALVAVGGAGLVSLAAPLPQTVEPGSVRAPQDPQTLEAGQVPEAAPMKDADLVEAAPAAPQDSTTETADSAVDIETAPNNRPEIASTSEAPQGGAQPAKVTAPVVPETPEQVALGSSPDTPEIKAPAAAPIPETGDSAPTVSTESAEELLLPAAEAEDNVIAALPNEDSLTTDPAIVPRVDAPANAAEPSVKTSLPVIEAPQLDANGEAGLPETIAKSAPAPELETVPVAETPNLDSPQQEVRLAQLPQAGAEDADAAGPSIGKRVLPLTEREADNSTEASLGTAAGEASGEVAAGMPPFEAHSVDVDVISDLPYMSIVLIEGPGAVGAEALEDFPYPLTFAIDPSAPDAAQRMADRRAAGFEVMVLADLPRAATPQDAETAMPVWLDTLPKAMGILEGVETGVQGNRPLADQVASLARDMGYGLVLQDNGLNTVQKLAKREGVPSGVVFRDFDGAGQNPRAIRRFLDQAAFRAGQEGAVIMLGRLKPDTISALLLWGLQDRASRVALVPASSSLRLLQER